MTAPPAPSTRDRPRTEALIRAAAREVLAETGFQGFGVNAVARRAHCDKQLIYRYFGGIEGLVDAIGADLATWIEDSLAPDSALPPESYSQLSERLILGFLDAFRANRLIQQIALWELADPSPLVARLTQSRSAAMLRWMARARGDLSPPAGFDSAALNALLIAALQQLVLSGAATGSFAGLDLRSDADWMRVRAAAVRMIRAAYES